MPTRGRPDQQRIAELIGQGLSPALAKREERAERAGFRAEGATRAYSKYDQAARRRSAESKGYGGPGKARRAREAARAGDTSKLRGEQAPPKPSGRRQVFTTPAGTIVKTTPGGKGMHVLQRRIENAGRGTRAKVLVTMSDGRTLNLYGKGGTSTAHLRRRIEDEGDLYGAIDADLGEVYGDAYAGGATVVSVQVVIA